MNFDKKAYYKRRAEGLRGQEELTQARVYQKGEKIEYVNREGQLTEYPNAQGAEMVYIKRQPVFLSREEYRRRNRNQSLGARKKFKHQVNDPFVPEFIPGTNHERMLARAEKRGLKKLDGAAR